MLQLEQKEAHEGSAVDGRLHPPKIFMFKLDLNVRVLKGGAFGG